LSVDFVRLKRDNDAERSLNAAFDALELSGVPRLLDAEDIVAMRVPDKLRCGACACCVCSRGVLLDSIVTYVSEIYKVFSGTIDRRL
jgi:hypothetical protein